MTPIREAMHRKATEELPPDLRLKAWLKPALPWARKGAFAFAVLGVGLAIWTIASGMGEGPRAAANRPIQAEQDRVAALYREAYGHFTLDGQPVHPGCVRELTASLSDPGSVAKAVDLLGGSIPAAYAPLSCYTGEYTGMRTGDVQHASFEYRRVGVTADGIHVLEVRESHESEGLYRSLVLVRLEPCQIYSDGAIRASLRMNRIGEVPLGEADQGVVVVSGSRIRIGRSQHRAQDRVLDTKTWSYVAQNG
ncbi:MAG: hypothetical protein HS116_20525 [Planctomycetes bacterium]|nr:hypothetical protein [Planctomycetota bacterium]